jgi:ribosomal protein L37AE/L43A
MMHKNASLSLEFEWYARHPDLGVETVDDFYEKVGISPGDRTDYATAAILAGTDQYSRLSEEEFTIIYLKESTELNIQCPDCKVIMENIGEVELEDKLFWCSKCGSIVTGYAFDGHLSVEKVERKVELVETVSIPEESFPEGACYLNTMTGDLFLVFWKQNIPQGTQWVKISRQCYNQISNLGWR